MPNFTFNTQDCIDLRKRVLQFYQEICSFSSDIPNVVDANKPYEDVVSDFQMIIYCYLMNAANREVENAATMQIDGKQVIRKEAKLPLATYRRYYKFIRTYMPMNDVNFVSQYSDVDEAICEQIDNIMHQTYYPLLNNCLKVNVGMRSEIAQTVAHLITGMCFMVMAAERGMIQNHKVPCKILKEIGNTICYTAAATCQVNNTGIDFDTVILEKSMTDALQVVVNSTEKTMMDIMDHAKTLDLKEYVDAADMTKDHFDKEYSKLLDRVKQARAKHNGKPVKKS